MEEKKYQLLIESVSLSEVTRIVNALGEGLKVRSVGETEWKDVKNYRFSFYEEVEEGPMKVKDDSPTGYSIDECGQVIFSPETRRSRSDNTKVYKQAFMAIFAAAAIFGLGILLNF